MEDARQKLSPTVVLADAFKSASRERTKDGGGGGGGRYKYDAMIDRP